MAKVTMVEAITMAMAHEMEKDPSVVVLGEDVGLNGGVGAEIAATVAEKAIYSLKAPIGRVTGYDIPMPLFKLEHDYMPSVERVLKGIRKVLEA